MITALSGLLVCWVGRAATAVGPCLAAAEGDGDSSSGSVQALGNAFQAIRQSVRTEGRHSPIVLLIVVAAALISAMLYGMWRWGQQRTAEPSSWSLLNLACDQLSLSSSQRQLLWLLGRQAGLEPASALASPQLLAHLVEQAEQAGLRLSSSKTLQIGRIHDAVLAACA
jgi:hypothetical protein